jgi:hypothetical protein
MMIALQKLSSLVYRNYYSEFKLKNALHDTNIPGFRRSIRIIFRFWGGECWYNLEGTKGNEIKRALYRWCAIVCMWEREREVPVAKMSMILENPIPLCIARAMAIGERERERVQAFSGCVENDFSGLCWG